MWLCFALHPNQIRLSFTSDFRVWENSRDSFPSILSREGHTRAKVLETYEYEDVNQNLIVAQSYCGGWY